MALRDAACLLVQLLGCMFRVDLLGANQKTDQLFMHFPCLICKKGASKWFSEAPCDNFQYLRSCNDFLVQTRQVRSNGLLLCIISRDHSKIFCLFLTMEPETEFNPKQMQNPQDNGFEKNVLSWHIWFKPEFHGVPSCMFLFFCTGFRSFSRFETRMTTTQKKGPCIPASQVATSASFFTQQNGLHKSRDGIAKFHKMIFLVQFVIKAM